MGSTTDHIIGLDFGTTNTKACSTFFSPGSTNVNDNIPFVHFNRHEIETPMVLSYTQDRRLIEGQEVEERLRGGHNRIDEGQCIRFLKLALQPDEKTKVFADRVIECARRFGKTPGDVVADYIRLIVGKIRRIIASTITAEHTDTMPLHLIISVPQLWTAETCRILTDAARSVCQKCSIVQEPFCAAGQYIWDEVRKPSLSMRIRFKASGALPQSSVDLLLIPTQAGDLILLIDGGGGTSDLILFMLCDEPASPNFRIKVIGPARGCLAAGSAVDQRFEIWLRVVHFKTVSALEQAAQSINYAPEELVLRAMAMFELEKRKFKGLQTSEEQSDEEHYTINIWRRPGGREKKVEIELTGEQMQSFFDPVIEDLKEEIRAILKGVDDLEAPSRLKAVALCGGFGRNRYVMDSVEAMFPKEVQLLDPNYNLSHKSAVARGSLLRYTFPFEEPATWSLLITRDEPYNRSLHPDIRNVKALPISFLDGSRVAEDRVHYIYNGLTKTVSNVWSTYYLPCFDEGPVSFSVAIYWTEKEQLMKHEPFRETGNATPRNCFQLFRTIPHVIQDPTSAGCRKILNPHSRRKGEPKHLLEVHVCHVVEKDEVGIKVCLFVQDPAQGGLFHEYTPDESWVPIVDKSTNAFEQVYEKDLVSCQWRLTGGRLHPGRIISRVRAQC